MGAVKESLSLGPPSPPVPPGSLTLCWFSQLAGPQNLGWNVVPIMREKTRWAQRPALPLGCPVALGGYLQPRFPCVIYKDHCR